MAYHSTNALAIGFALLHTILSAAHFTGGNHLHRTGDLLRILHATDLFLYFLANSHLVFSLAA
jgi:hypothetical protein